MKILSILTDGGQHHAQTKHCECRECGANLSPDVDACPDCGGDVAIYSF